METKLVLSDGRVVGGHATMGNRNNATKLTTLMLFEKGLATLLLDPPLLDEDSNETSSC